MCPVLSISRRSLRTLVTASAATTIVLLNLHIAFAGDLEDGIEAFLAEDYSKAIRLLQPLAEQDEPRAQFYLGGMYDYGYGVAEDDENADFWYRRAATIFWTLAEQGDPDAQYHLGSMYDQGFGVVEDVGQAVARYQRAAEQGHFHARHALAAAYAYGRGVPRDPEQAAHWVRTAEADNPKTSASAVAETFELFGFMFELGVGVLADSTQSAYWYSVAAEERRLVP